MMLLVRPEVLRGKRLPEIPSRCPSYGIEELCVTQLEENPT